MQKAIPAKTGIQITSLFIAFSSFLVMQNPLKHMWVTGLLSLSMLYFSVKKYKEDKASGVDTTKSRDIMVMAAVASLAILIIFVGYNLAEMGVFGDM